MTEISCPGCGQVNRCHHDVAGDLSFPRRGDWSICMGCRVVAVFDDGPHGLHMRLPNEAEAAEMAANAELRRSLDWADRRR